MNFIANQNPELKNKRPNDIERQVVLLISQYKIIGPQGAARKVEKGSFIETFMYVNKGS